jgi:hypothetical protein
MVTLHIIRDKPGLTTIPATARHYFPSPRMGSDTVPIKCSLVINAIKEALTSHRPASTAYGNPSRRHCFPMFHNLYIYFYRNDAFLA